MSDRRPEFHWSKDYVEHLRAVHFSLIAVCASLIVLVGNSVDYDAKRAFHQAQDVQDFVKAWKSDWVFSQLQAQPSAGATCQYSSSEHGDLIEITSENPQRLQGTRFPAPRSQSAIFNLQLPKPSWFQPGTFGAGKSGVMKSLAAMPSTMSEFRAWWDELQVLTPVNTDLFPYVARVSVWFKRFEPCGPVRMGELQLNQIRMPTELIEAGRGGRAESVRDHLVRANSQTSQGRIDRVVADRAVLGANRRKHVVALAGQRVQIAE
jgi:hypothetical protein